MMPEDSKYTLPVTVCEVHIDLLGHVNNVVYLQWVQDVASAHWSQLAPPALQKELAWVVLRHEINYHKPARLHDELMINTWVGETEGYRSVRHVEIRNTQGALVVSALTTWCLIDPVSQRPKKITEDIRNALIG